MNSFEKDLQSISEKKINLLTQLKEKISELDQELETLNSMKEETELKLRDSERPGRRRKVLVDKWLKDVEQIEKKRQDIMNQINDIFTYKSTDEVFEEVIKDVENYQWERPSSAVGLKQTVIGIGGFDKANINLTNSPTTLNIGTIVNHPTPSNGEGKA